MKKLFLIISLLICSCVCALVGCDNSRNSTAETKKIVLNSFDHYDDMKMFAMETTIFYGALRVNNDTTYARDGKSMEVEFVAVDATSPFLPAYASDIGITNISSVEKFGVYIYNDTSAPFTFSLTAKDAAGTVVFVDNIEAAMGENNVEFITDRSLLQYIGTTVHSFELQFINIGVGKIYIDDLYAITTTAKAEPIRAVDELLSAISTLDESNREEVFRVYNQYKALDSNYKRAITSYPILKSVVDGWYKNELFDAKENDSNTILFFNEPFGELQVETKSQEITTCAYSTEWAVEGESGSLKLMAEKSANSWLGLYTSAKIDRDAPYVKFTVFNDSDQEKYLSLNWQNKWLIPANSEMTIVANSTWLTRNEIGAGGGVIYYCGVLGGWQAVCPEGTLYISSVKDFDPNEEERAFLLLSNANSYYAYYWHGSVYGLSLEDNTLAMSVAQNGNGAYGGGSGATMQPSTIKELYDLGFTKLTFKLNMEEGLYCAIFIDGDIGLNYLSGTATSVTADNIYIYESGAEITIDLRVLAGNLKFMRTPCSDVAGGLHFVVMTAAEYLPENIYKDATTMTLSDIVLTEQSQDDLGEPVHEGVAVLASADSHYFMYWHGALVDIVANENNLLMSVAQNGNGAYGGGVGTTLLPSTIQMLYDMGYKSITFTLGISNDLYCVIYVDNDRGLNYLSGTAAAITAEGHYFYQAGAEITIDLKALVSSVAFMSTPCSDISGGLHFAVFTGTEFVGDNAYKNQTTITLSDISFEEHSGDEVQPVGEGVEILMKGDSHYFYYYHGTVIDFSVDGDSLVMVVAQNGNAEYGGGVGTTLFPSAIKALYDLGYKKLTFTLGMESGLYCAIFIDNAPGLNYISGNSAAVNENVYIYESGTEITIDLEVLVNNATFMETVCTNVEGGLHFVVLSGAEYVAENIYQTQTTIAMNDIKFE